MEEEEAALLAELRAISARSSNARFRDEDNDDIMNKGLDKGPNGIDSFESKTKKTSKQDMVEIENEEPKSKFESHSCRDSSEEAKSVSSWKRETKKKINDKPIIENQNGFKSALPNAFNGDHGGKAEDSDLLAELRAISKKSSINRFDNNDIDNVNQNTLTSKEEQPNDMENIVSTKLKVDDYDDVFESKKRQSHFETPWKRKANSKKIKNEVCKENADHEIKDDLSHTTKNDHGEPNGKSAVLAEVAIISGVPSKISFEDSTKSLNSISQEGSSISNLKRGGYAEDAELLAELQAISTKSSKVEITGKENLSAAEEFISLSMKNSHTIQNDGNARGSVTSPIERSCESNIKVKNPNQYTSVPPWRRTSKQANNQPEANTELRESSIVPNSSAETVEYDNPGKFTSNVSQNFTGDRGGSAEDADLLAELRAISSKSSKNRFEENELNDEDVKVTHETEVIKVDNPKKASSVPPWKRPKKPMKKKESEVNGTQVDVVVETPKSNTALEPSSETVECNNTGNFKSNMSQTFKGDRGGTAEDADLIAELRAISSKSSKNRFEENELNNEDVKVTHETEVIKVDNPKKASSVLPPWKRPKKPMKKKESEVNGTQVDVVVETPKSNTALEPSSETVECNNTGNFKSNMSQTFKGDRGGTAEDADLIAELRAISSKSSKNRFEENELNNEDVKVTHETEVIKVDNPKKASSVPPWKRPKKPMKKKESAANGTQVEMVVETSKSNTALEPSSETVECNNTGNFKSNMSQTFKGDRGGTAEDADLLAELRAISSKASRNRFEENELNNEDVKVTHETEVIKVDNPKKASSVTPPWKLPKKPMKKKESAANGTQVEMVVETSKSNTVPESSSETVECSNTGNFKSNMSQTFKGDRGGTAEDADLIAELRAISSKSSKNRFVENELNNEDVKVTHETEVIKVDNPKKASSVPPWKRPKKPMKKNESAANGTQVDMVVETSKSNTVPESSSETVECSNTGNFKSNMSQTFKGDRGGSAEDADLLAELRAISSKASKNRFEENELNDEDVVTHETEVIKVDNPKKASSVTPPWKLPKKPMKKNESAANGTQVDMVVETSKSNTVPESSSETVECSNTGNFKSNMSQTFKGDRGGTAEDADLIAELRAISSKSSKNRFVENELNNEDVKVTHETEVIKVDNPKKASSVPPWKRPKKPMKKKESESCNTQVDMVVETSKSNTALEPSSETVECNNTGNFKSNMSQTFKGDRGGSAEDADLLAELRAISSKASKNRFEENELNNEDVKVTHETEVIKVDNPKKASSVLPPWKRPKKPMKKKESETNEIQVEMVVETPKSSTLPESSSETVECSNTGNFKSNMSQTFKGDRGGTAEDADLIAELRAISSKSSKNRFEENDLNDEGVEVTDETEVIKEEFSNKASSVLPPWKRPKKPMKKNQSKTNEIQVETIVEASKSSTLPESSAVTMECNNTGNFKSNASQTFKGNRGGSAEDADLLAELRAISSKASNNRFEENELNDEFDAAEVLISTKEVSSVPPWKRSNKTLKKKASEGNEIKKKVNVQAPKPSNITETSSETMEANSGTNFVSKAPQTFNGNRGGSAEDADLLAELRAVSMKASKSRFKDNELKEIDVNSSKVDSTENIEIEDVKGDTHVPGSVIESNFLKSLDGASSSAGKINAKFSRPEEATINDDSKPLVTAESLSESVGSKDSKTRKASFELLSSILTETNGDNEPMGIIDGDVLMEGLDSLVPVMVQDSNVFALEAALDFAVSYADCCSGAQSSNQATKIVSAMFKGNAMSSTRPSTTKLSKALILKLMEVGSSGTDSVHAVVDVLLDKGMSSRKPKIVLSSTNLILDTALSFGAACLPIFQVSSKIPSMLSHSNPSVREAGMKLLAEICRALGSKDHMQNIIDSLKSSQLSQLDLYLVKNPQPLQPTIILRSSSSSSGSKKSPSDMIAALHSNAKEEEKKRLESRPAVDLEQALSKTEFYSVIKLVKWSEKVKALQMVIDCGGDKPYKIASPSKFVNYTDIVRELKSNLEKSHFAVSTKALEALGMLAEGVGEKMFSMFRPLLMLLTGLFKDKKLTSAVGKCLDSFFGNVLSFEHLLEKDCSIPSAVNEKTQKNALSRKSTLEWLHRSIERGESAGIKGILTPNIALEIAKLASSKLKDTDTGSRKVSLDILQILSSNQDLNISGKVSSVIDELKESNPRAYKQMANTTKCNSDKSESRPQLLPKASNNDVKSSLLRQASSKLSSKVPSPRLGTSSRQNSMKSLVEDKKDIIKVEDNECILPSLEEAMSVISNFKIPNWDAVEDDGGIVAGLQSTKWQTKKTALEAIGSSLQNLSSNQERLEFSATPWVVVVKHYTRGFKESNFNLMKAIIEFFLYIFQVHEEIKKKVESWICREAISVAIDKIADKKLGPNAMSLLTSLCVVQMPGIIASISVKFIGNVKSPTSHEKLLNWFLDTSINFGATLYGNDIKSLSSWIIKECESTNLKVRSAALALIAELHIQLGPTMKALLKQATPDSLSSSIKNQIDITFETSPYDPDSTKVSRSKTCIVSSFNGLTSESDSTPLITIDIPRFDLVSSLPEDCIERMGSKEGKTSWKHRKGAMEEVASSLKKCDSLLLCSASSILSLCELVKALRERLNDSQSNLKPIAAELIGNILSSVDEQAKSKIGKEVFPPLINAVINDNKKNMRLASMSSVRKGIDKHSLDGSGPSPNALECFLSSFISELNKSGYKGGGLPEILAFVAEKADCFPKFCGGTNSKALSFEKQLAQVLVGCLTASKSETRSAAEIVLKKFVENCILSLAFINKAVKALAPAHQRAVTVFIDAFNDDKSGVKPENIAKEAPRILRRPSGKLPKNSTPMNARPSPRNNRSSTKSEKKYSLNSSETDSLNKASFPSVDDSSCNSNQHPLCSVNSISIVKEDRANTRNWPEYPEEPTERELQSLKKMWSPMLPPSSSTYLFPSKGIINQEDSLNGLNILTSAVILAEENQTDSVLFNQLDLIFKWLVCAMCSREHTTGYLAILDLLTKIFLLLRERNYQLTDLEANILLPYILDKGSISKGRFRELFLDLIESITKEPPLYIVQKYGQLICINILERSSTPKTRVLVMNECLTCVDKIGITAVGKKGISIIVKSLSDETRPENRNAALDVIDMVLTKINGDTKKLFKVCGKTNVPEKTKSLIEERWTKRHGYGDGTSSLGSSCSSVRKAESPRVAPIRLLTPRSRSSTPLTSFPSSRRQDISATKFSMLKQDSLRGRDLRSESVGKKDSARKNIANLPTFKLKLEDSCSENNKSLQLTPSGPYRFSYAFDSVSKREKVNPESIQNQNSTKEESAPISLKKNSLSSETLNSSSSPNQTAANLRARLQQIRVKKSKSSNSICESASVTSSTDENRFQNSRRCIQLYPELSSDVTCWEDIRNILNSVLCLTTHIPDDNPVLVQSGVCLKKMHTSITQADTDSSLSEELRSDILSHASDCVKTLTRTISFSFECGNPGQTAGICVSLLSVSLAILMAFFRHPIASLTISQDAIEDIIRLTGTKLLDSRLDSRLTSACSSAIVSVLDSSTKDQLVRAVNKLAIQAAIGSSRMESLLALMSLQVELCDKVLTNYDTTCRLSRVFAKLFARVLKAEESTGSLLSRDTFDLQSLLQTLALMISACDAFTASYDNAASDRRDNANVSCTNMAKSLVLFLLKSGVNPNTIQTNLDELRMDSRSPIRKLLESCKIEVPNTTELTSPLSLSREKVAVKNEKKQDLSNESENTKLSKQSTRPPEESFRSSSSCLRARLNALKRGKHSSN